MESQVIRRMMRHDIQSIEDDFDCPLKLREYYKHRDVEAIVVDEEGVVAGYLIAMRDGTVIEILHMEVAEDKWGQGLGSEMLDHLDLITEEDMSIECALREADSGSHIFFKKNGYSCVGNMTVDGDPGYLFRKGWRFRRAPQEKYRM